MVRIERSDDVSEPRFPEFGRWGRWPWSPSGGWALVALGAVTLAAVCFGWATTVPADPRFFVPAAGSAVVAFFALGLAVRDGEGLGGRWAATTAATVLASLVLLAFRFPISTWTVPLVLVAVAAVVPLSIGVLVLTVRSLAGNRWDAVAAVLVAAAMFAIGGFDDVRFRLDDDVRADLAEEAVALGADGAAPEVDSIRGDRRAPFVVAGTDRTVIAWPIQRWDTSLPVLAYDPQGHIGGDGAVGMLDACRRISGPWWTCSAG